MRDPANNLYDRGCSLLDAARSLREAALAPESQPALAATLGCVEESLEELVAAVAVMKARALEQPDARDQVTGRLELLRSDLAAAKASCGASREAAAPLVEAALV